MRASYVEPILKQHTFPSADAGCRWAGAATSIALVHVGKTGGESLVNMLQGAGVAFTWIHDPGAVMVFDDPHCDPAEECWWPPQAALACEGTYYIITPRDGPRHRCHRVASGDALRHTIDTSSRALIKDDPSGVVSAASSVCVHTAVLQTRTIAYIC